MQASFACMGFAVNVAFDVLIHDRCLISASIWQMWVPSLVAQQLSSSVASHHNHCRPIDLVILDRHQRFIRLVQRERCDLWL